MNIADELIIKKNDYRFKGERSQGNALYCYFNKV